MFSGMYSKKVAAIEESLKWFWDFSTYTHAVLQIVLAAQLFLLGKDISFEMKDLC